MCGERGGWRKNGCTRERRTTALDASHRRLGWLQVSHMSPSFPVQVAKGLYLETVLISGVICVAILLAVALIVVEVAAGI